MKFFDKGSGITAESNSPAGDRFLQRLSESRRKARGKERYILDRIRETLHPKYCFLWSGWVTFSKDKSKVELCLALPYSYSFHGPAGTGKLVIVDTCDEYHLFVYDIREVTDFLVTKVYGKNLEEVRLEKVNHVKDGLTGSQFNVPGDKKEVRFCPVCGMEDEKGKTYCVKCGAPLKEEEWLRFSQGW